MGVSQTGVRFQWLLAYTPIEVFRVSLDASHGFLAFKRTQIEVARPLPLPALCPCASAVAANSSLKAATLSRACTRPCSSREGSAAFQEPLALDVRSRPCDGREKLLNLSLMVLVWCGAVRWNGQVAVRTGHSADTAGRGRGARCGDGTGCIAMGE